MSDIQNMTLAEIDAELARRNEMALKLQDAVESGDLLEAGLLMFRKNPDRILSESSTFARLMELDANRKANAKPSLELDKLSAIDLQRMSLSDLMMLLTTVVLEHVPEDRREAALQMLRR